MRHFLLSAKHWQVFLYTSGLPVLYNILMEIFNFNSNPFYNGSFQEILSGQPMNPEMVQSMDLEQMLDFAELIGLVSMIVGLLYIITFSSWLWNVTLGMQQVLKSEERLNLRTFKILFIVPIICYIVFALLFKEIFQGIQNNDIEIANFGFMFLMLLIMFPIALYLMYVTAKAIKSAEVGQKQNMGEVMGEFFLILFFFIGVFAIQPKVNMIYEKGWTS